MQTQEVIDHVRESIYKRFVIYVDANDNGVDKVKDVNTSVSTTLWSRVSKINPMWWQESDNELQLFHKAMAIVEEEFHSEVRQTILYSSHH